MRVNTTGDARRGWRRLAVVFGMSASLAISGCGSGGPATDPSSLPRDLDGLIEAAKAEGELTIYGANAPEVVENVARKFEEKYGITVNAVRLSSSQLYTRFAAEAETGNPGADVILPTFGERDVEAIRKYVTPLDEAGIPGYPENFPEHSRLPEFDTAAVNYVENGIAYNTDLVAEGDVPTSWADLADPKWNGQIVAAYPNSSPNTLNLFNYLRKKFGPELLEALHRNGIRFVEGASPAIQSVAASEAALALPGNAPFIVPLAEQGAPIAYQPLEETSGLRISAHLAAKAAHPAAARLFLHFVLSEEGAAAFTGAPGATSPFDEEGMKRISPEEPTSADEEAEILRLLGEA